MSHVILQTFTLALKNKSINNSYFCIIFILLIYGQSISIAQQSIKKNFVLLQDPIVWKLVYFLNDSVASFLIMMCVFLYWCNPIKYNRIYIYLILGLQTTLVVPTLYNLVSFTVNYNSILNNGLLNIHPIYLYIGSSILLLLYLLYDKNYTNNETNKITLLFVFFKSMNLSFFFNSTVALVLGCVWAQQELNWGGWWNWDPIEFVALLLTLFSLVFIHINYIKICSTLIVFIKFTPQLLLIFYMLSRHNIISSIHSFISSINQPLYCEIQSVCIIFLGLRIFFTLSSFFFIAERQIHALYHITSYITIASLLFIIGCAIHNTIWQGVVYYDIQNIRYYYLVIYSLIFASNSLSILTKQHYKLFLGIISIVVLLGIIFYEIILLLSLFVLVKSLSKRNSHYKYSHKIVNLHIIVTSAIIIIYLYSRLDFIWFLKYFKNYSQEYIRYYNTVNFLFFEGFVCRINEIPNQITFKVYYLVEFFHENKLNILVDKLIQWIFLKPAFNVNLIMFKKTLLTNQFALGFILLLVVCITSYTYLIKFRECTQVV